MDPWAREVQHRPTHAGQPAAGPSEQPRCGRLGGAARDYVQKLAPSDVDEAGGPSLGANRPRRHIRCPSRPSASTSLMRAVSASSSAEPQRRTDSYTGRQLHPSSAAMSLRGRPRPDWRVAQRPRPRRELLALGRDLGVLPGHGARRAVPVSAASPTLGHAWTRLGAGGGVGPVWGAFGACGGEPGCPTFGNSMRRAGCRRSPEAPGSAWTCLGTVTSDRCKGAAVLSGRRPGGAGLEEGAFS